MEKISKIIKKNSPGFTLIEVLVAATIIGLLTMIGVVSYQQAMKKSRDGKRKSDLSALQQAIEIYRSDNASYPATVPTSGTWTSTSGNTYMQNVPQDPKAGYNYAYQQSGERYNLCAYLESKSTSDADCGFAGGCGATSCNYGVTNP